MSKLGQKDAVIAEVITRIPTFQKFQDNAILKLSATQVEDIKSVIYQGIINGHIEYSKDVTDLAECRAYARSMVMNHLKKAKELNGGHAFTKRADKVVREKVATGPKGVNLDLLPQELREVVEKWR